MSQMKSLMSAMDHYFVLNDLNILFSRFNFGFKKLGSEDYLTILDLGHVLPKIYPETYPICPHCGQFLSYITIADDFYQNADDAFKSRLKAHLILAGAYSCKNKFCNANGKGNDPYIEEDDRV